MSEIAKIRLWFLGAAVTGLAICGLWEILKLPDLFVAKLAVVMLLSFSAIWPLFEFGVRILIAFERLGRLRGGDGEIDIVTLHTRVLDHRGKLIRYRPGHFDRMRALARSD